MKDAIESDAVQPPSFVPVDQSQLDKQNIIICYRTLSEKLTV